MEVCYTRVKLRTQQSCLPPTPASTEPRRVCRRLFGLNGGQMPRYGVMTRV